MHPIWHWPLSELFSFVTVLSNAISFAAMEMDSPPNEGLDFTIDAGWEQFLSAIDQLIDL